LAISWVASRSDWAGPTATTALLATSRTFMAAPPRRGSGLALP
jgi:hypothetical protein